MKSNKIVLFSIILAALFSSCYKKGGPWGIRGKGKTITETRNVSGFNRINLSENANIYFVQDSIYRVEISAQENIIRLVETTVKSSELQLTFSRNVWDHEEIKVVVHAPDLTGINISGQGDVIVEKPLKTTALTMQLSGNGDVDIAELQCSSLKINLSGLSSVKISGGEVAQEDITLSGIGDIDLLQMKSAFNKTNISGSGDVKVWVTEKLDVTISGIGDLSYKGKPTVTSDISGSGKIISLD